MPTAQKSMSWWLNQFKTFIFTFSLLWNVTPCDNPMRGVDKKNLMEQTVYCLYKADVAGSHRLIFQWFNALIVLYAVLFVFFFFVLMSSRFYFTCQHFCCTSFESTSQNTSIEPAIFQKIEAIKDYFNWNIWYN